jgi:probable F420-dependent oxidoreductase
MTAVAGEVADGLHAHGFTTADYLRDVTVPHLRAGLARAGRSRADVEISVPAMFAVVDDARDPRLDATRTTIAFYGSTPAYRSVLEHHGWGALGDELHALSRRGEWTSMGRLVDDDVLHAIAVVGDAAHVGAEIVRRYGGLVDRIQLALGRDEDHLAPVLDAIRASSSSTNSTTVRSSTPNSRRHTLTPSTPFPPAAPTPHDSSETWAGDGGP